MRFKCGSMSIVGVERKLNFLGDEEKALKIDKLKYQQCIRDGKKLPSEVIPYAAVYILVNEINNKIK